MKAQRNIVMAAIVVLAACDGGTDITVDNLEGTWDATAYVYTSKANPAQSADIVALHKATMLLVVQTNGTTASTFYNGRGSTSSDSGNFNAADGNLTLAGVTYQAALDGDRLTLTSGTAEYDFDGNGSKDPATARISFRRR